MVGSLANSRWAAASVAVSLLRIAMGAAERGLDRLVDEGSLKGEVAQMQTRARLYELLDYEAYNAFDTSVFNFDVPAAR